tara:strand:- start:541 stop:819 length:279 start_codon:yes stop_codon:yes gene_type:complete
MIVRKLTIAQRAKLIGIVYKDGMTFNPVLDAGDTTLDKDGFHVLDKNGEPTGLNRNWFISNEEVDQCDHNEVYHDWIHDLPEIEYNPVKTRI